ncbi:hypothetical protein D9M68_859190 [compost metagenome]
MREGTAMYDHIGIKGQQVEVIGMCRIQGVEINGFGCCIRQVCTHYLVTLFFEMFQTIAAQQTGCTGNEYFQNMCVFTI